MTMNLLKYSNLLLIPLVIYSKNTYANEVEILSAAILHQSQNEYLVSVTLQHQDSGWNHYADAWRIVDQQGAILGTRTLMHPHVEEQPFSRALNNVKIDESLITLYIEAHDNVHGWSTNRLKIDLNAMQAGRLITRQPSQ